MVTFWATFLGICFLFLFSGLFFGLALRTRTCETFSKKNASLSNECASLEEKLQQQSKSYATLQESYEKLIDEFSVLRKENGRQKKEIHQLSSASIAMQSAARENNSLKSGAATYQHEINGLKSELNILSMQLSAKHDKIAELEKYRPYYDKFTELSKLTLRLRDYNTRLKQELKHLRSIGISLDHFGRNSRQMTFEKTDNPAAIYNAVLSSAAAHRNSRGGVISDDMGFTIASNSDFGDELAGISVLYQYCEEIINKNITFSSLSKVIFINDNDLCLTLFPLVINNQTVYFSGLSQGLIDIKPINQKVSEAIIIN